MHFQLSESLSFKIHDKVIKILQYFYTKYIFKIVIQNITNRRIDEVEINKFLLNILNCTKLNNIHLEVE